MFFQITDELKVNGMLITVDIQKKKINFSPKRYGFSKIFIKWIKTLLSNHESCIINGVNLTRYFELDKEAHQRYPMSAYLFILVLETVFNLIKENKKIHDLTFFDHTFVHTAYADDTTFILKEKESVKVVMNAFDTFLIYSGLKPNKSKCEIAFWKGCQRNFVEWNV